MATTLNSPGIVTREVDLTGVVPANTSSIGAIVGNYRWGPVGTRELISNEKGLVSKFGTPTAQGTVDFHSAAYFLRYTSNLFVTRMVTDIAKNASSGAKTVTIKNEDDYNTQIGTLTDEPTEYTTTYSIVVTVDSADTFAPSVDDDITIAVDSDTSFGLTVTGWNDTTKTITAVYTGTSYVLNPLSEVLSGQSVTIDGNATDLATVSTITKLTQNPTSQFQKVGMWVAKYPGAIGNSIGVSFCVANPNGTGTEDFTDWSYKSYFDSAPGTSAYAGSRNASNDEIHVVVYDVLGYFTGSIGAVLETYPFVSVMPNAKTNDGSSNYVANIINNKSNYVWFGDFDTDLPISDTFGTEDVTTTTNYTDGVIWTNGTSKTTLSKGVDSGSLTTSEFLLGYDLYQDKDVVTVDFLIAPSPSDVISHNTIVNSLVSTAQGLRKDCVVVCSPNRDSVVNNSGIVEDTVACYENVTKSSYLFKENNFIKVYDKYNDQYIFIPAASSTAGIMAATDLVAAPFYSPAGAKRGQYLGITALAYTPTQSERDTLYKVGINSIANIPGQGIMLYGDKTAEARPSAFDRINVRRLFLMIERAISVAARNVMFEFNDEFTRAEFVNIVEPYLRNIKGRRGVYDFRVVCDETNNTPDIVDNNEFVADIYIKPARTINYVTLNFVAVRTGASFEEIVGLA